MWYNAKTGELQSNPPYDGYLDPEKVAELYPGWQQVAVDFVPPLTPAQEKAAAAAPINAQMAALEATMTPRLLREAFLNSTTINSKTGRTSAQQLAFIDTQIAALRTQLV